MTRKNRSLWLAVAALSILAVVFRSALLSAAGHYLVKAQSPQKAGIVIVLAGDFAGLRIRASGDLVKQGYAPRALVSGPSGFYGRYECDLAIPYAVAAGYPETYFEHFENEARSTADEARALAPKLRALGVKRALLVTSDYHTRRAGGAFRRIAPDLEWIVIAAPDDNFTPGGWWHSREGRKTFLGEWMKTVGDWLRL